MYRKVSIVVSFLFLFFVYIGLAKAEEIGRNKVSKHVLAAAEQLNSEAGLAKRAELMSNSVIRINQQGAIQVYIHVSEVSTSTLAALRAAGVEVDISNQELGIVQGWIDRNKVLDIAEMEFIRSITPPEYAKKMAGSIVTQGDAILKSDLVRIDYGYDGTGVRIGVISDGVDSRADAAATGDLPQSIEINPQLPGEGDEGTAMLEIVYDIAPGAELAFSGGFSTSLNMIASIEYLANTAFDGQGCDVIIDDLGFFTQPAFEDGDIADKVTEVVNAGAVYVTSAGNQAQEHYENDFLQSTLNIDGQQKRVHDFGLANGGGSDLGMLVELDGNTELKVILQWSDTYANAANDYGTYILNASMDTVLAAGDEDQGFGYPWPVEIASFENTSTQKVNINVVVQNNDEDGRFFELNFSASGDGFFEIVDTQYNVEAGSVVPGQQSSIAALTIGAVPSYNIVTVQNFSSRGPAKIFYPEPENRQKPELAGIDAVHITGAGGFGQFLLDNWWFAGTSAAAPHAGAVAALLLDAVPDLTPPQVKQALTSTAVDLGDTGVDYDAGYGRIDALAAIQSVVVSSAESQSGVPESYALGQNYPNPFNPTTAIQYTLPASHGNADVKLEIFNLLGQKILTLVNRTQTAGTYRVVWEGKNDLGRQVSNGVYLYRLNAGSFESVKKMLLVR